ncbi:CRISPR-associated helicase/endonuclease Cas3 [Geothermobacter hydrogeniphilus]|uniref:CRISPR-associated helicase/endonuclease Cas3 n=2 Tax=Geothermobacter hydrogeniphilus TaxID=1969733 RepID=A0A1X0Y2B0_9BACT|nr:CRISPR-associated helicase/endonuclease Cas3 [Geothermobacter hydrogeniphilus]
MGSEGYFHYWGKTGEDGSCHLLPYHCLDISAVAAAWWELSPTIRRSFCQDSNEKEIRAWVLFFCALHDYGKFDLRFQQKDLPSFTSLYPLSGGTLPSGREVKDYWHGEAGLYWFHKDLIALYGTPDSGCGLFCNEEEPEHWPFWKKWIEAVTGHHGHLKNAEYVQNANFSSLVDQRYPQNDHVARICWLQALEELFLKPAGLTLTSCPPEPSPLLAGFCSIADWLGSRCDKVNFSLLATRKNLQTYFEEKVSVDAQRVLQLAGIVGHAKAFSGVGALLPAGEVPRPLQALIESLPLEPALTIVEAPTGTGKTETALAHAWRQIEAGLADSIIFALPTQATANAMFTRLERAAKVLFDDSPNLLLAHGHASQNEQFAALKKRSQPEAGEEQDGWVKCSEWLAESRKRVFLGQIGVCTIDQVLISVLPVRHRFVRGFGVGRSVLIVDEVHAYDAYMYGLLEEVLRQQKASGGSAILLSATLPAGQKEKLFAAWDAELKADESAPYPLISSAAGKKVEPCLLPEETPQEKVTVQLESLRVADMTPDADLISRLIVAAGKGAQVAVICNLVDVAQSLYERLMKGAKGLPIEVDLFHARFRFLDRQGKEAGVIGNFGFGGDRSKGRILVATQVVEQSLDVDFDWLVSQLCPVDLLFQRMGRLHRHAENDATRPIEFNKRCCTVLLPTGEDYGGTGVVYANTRVLWRTEQLLRDAEVVSFPDAYRKWIDEVYREEGWGNEPEWVESGFAKFEEEKWSKHYNARQMIHRAFEMNPFNDSDEQITAVTRDGEMSLTVIPYLASGGGRQTIDGDLLDSLDEYRLQEILMLNSVGVPAGWKGYLEKMAEYTEGRYWLEMQPDGGGFIAEGEKVIFRYRRDTGLRRVKK